MQKVLRLCAGVRFLRGCVALPKASGTQKLQSKPLEKTVLVCQREPYSNVERGPFSKAPKDGQQHIDPPISDTAEDKKAQHYPNCQERKPPGCKRQVKDLRFSRTHFKHQDCYPLPGAAPLPGYNSASLTALQALKRRELRKRKVGKINLGLRLQVPREARNVKSCVHFLSATPGQQQPSFPALQLLHAFSQEAVAWDPSQGAPSLGSGGRLYYHTIRASSNPHPFTL